MKPITLSPARLDAALGLPVRPAWCWGPTWCDANPCTCAHPDQPPIIPARRAGKTAAMPPTVTRTRKPRRGRAR